MKRIVCVAIIVIVFGVSFLLMTKSDQEETPPLSPDQELLQATAKGNLQAVKRLMETGANVNTTDKFGWTPLHIAALKNNLTVARLLIEHDADVDAQDKYRWTPIHESSMQGNLAFVELLLAEDADINVSDEKGEFGYTPLGWAAKGDHIEIVKLLLNTGTDINNQGLNNDTALDLAPSEELKNYLRQQGAKPGK